MFKAKLIVLLFVTACGLLSAETNVSVAGEVHTANVLVDEYKPDYSKMSLWLLSKKIEEGIPEAYYYYARKLERQATREEDTVKALKWYKKAAEEGNTQAQIVMMQRYYLGIGVSNDFTMVAQYGRTALAAPDASNREKGVVALYLAGLAFGDGKVREGVKFLVRTTQSPVFIGEYLAILLLTGIVCSYLFVQYRVSRKYIEQKYVWTLLDCLMAFLLLAAGTLFGEFFLFLIAVPVLHLPYLLSAMILSNIAIIGAICCCVLLARWRGVSLAEVFRLKWITWYKYPVWVFFGMWAILILRILYMAAAFLVRIPIRIQPIQQMLMHESSWGTLIPIIIDGVIGAAIFEELLFRGILHRTLRPWLPTWSVILLSSVIFGAVHLDPWNFVPLALTGLVLAISYEMTKSLTVPIMLHAANNLLGFVFMILSRYVS